MHEVHSDDPVGFVGDCGQTRDGDGASVGSEDCLKRSDLKEGDSVVVLGIGGRGDGWKVGVICH